MSEKEIRKHIDKRAYGSFSDYFMQQHGEDFKLEVQTTGENKDHLLFEEAKQLAITQGKLTTSSLVNSDLCSRAKAQRIMHQLRKAGVIGEHSPSLGYSPYIGNEETSK